MSKGGDLQHAITDNKYLSKFSTDKYPGKFSSQVFKSS